MASATSCVWAGGVLIAGGLHGAGWWWFFPYLGISLSGCYGANLCCSMKANQAQEGVWDSACSATSNPTISQAWSPPCSIQSPPRNPLRGLTCSGGCPWACWCMGGHYSIPACGPPAFTGVGCFLTAVKATSASAVKLCQQKQGIGLGCKIS